MRVFRLHSPVSEAYRDGLSLDGAGLLVADLVDHVQDRLHDVALAPEPDGVGHVTTLEEGVGEWSVMGEVVRWVMGEVVRWVWRRMARGASLGWKNKMGRNEG